MRILLVSASYYPVLGGLQTVTKSLATEWQAIGHEVQVVTQRYPRNLPAYATICGIPVWRRLFISPELEQIRGKRLDLFIAGLYYRYATQIWLNRKIEQFQPDVVNLHFPNSQIPFLLRSKKQTKFKIVVSLHGHDIEQWQQPDYSNSKYDRFNEIMRLANAVTACSQALLNQAYRLFPFIQNKASAIPNGVDVSRFNNKHTYIHKRDYFLAYGRLIYGKGMDMLLQAFSQYAQRSSVANLLIAGEGEQRTSLELLQAQMNLHDRVHFLGRVSPEKIAELLEGCKGVVIPSRQEAFGIVALEALAAGKPIVATRVGGLAEILEGTSNRLIAPNVDGLVSGLDWLNEDINWQAISAENKRLAQKYTWEESARKYLNVFQNAL